MTTLLRCAAALVFAILGVVCAVASLLVHADWWGGLLVWAVLVTLLVALPGGWHGRGAFAMGWIVVLVSALNTRPEGDFLVAADISGYVFLATAPVLVVAAVLGVAGRRARPTNGAELRGLDRAS